MEKKEKYLYFDTTVRNSLRLKFFLKAASKYDGQVLTNDLCVEIIKELIKNKVFKPLESCRALKNDDLTNKFGIGNNEDISDEEAGDLITVWQPSNIQAGFRGSKQRPDWAPRFFKFFEDARTFGLINFVAPGKNKKNEFFEDKFAKPFFITEIGKKLINTIQDDSIPLEPELSAAEEIIWCHILAKFQSNNPYSRRLQNLAPFPLFIKVLLETSNHKELDSKIYTREIPIFLLWPNNNWEELINFIKKFRKEIPHNANRYRIEDFILKELNTSKSWTADKSLDSAKDKFYRLLGSTGLFDTSIYTLRINYSQKDLAQYIADNYLDSSKHSQDNEFEYFKYSSLIDTKLLSYQRNETILDENKIDNVSSILELKQVIEELLLADKGSRSKLEKLKYIKAFVRYEYFCALLIHKQFKNTKVTANTKTDSFGWPIGHASGSRGTGADIECFELDFFSIVEPSLDTSGAGQIRELYSVYRHRDKLIQKNNLDDAKIFFVSPRIHRDMYEFSKDRAAREKKEIILNLTTNEIIDKINTNSSMKEIFNQ